jgi:hypothetical protein
MNQTGPMNIPIADNIASIAAQKGNRDDKRNFIA